MEHTHVGRHWRIVAVEMLVEAILVTGKLTNILPAETKNRTIRQLYKTGEKKDLCPRMEIPDQQSSIVWHCSIVG